MATDTAGALVVERSGAEPTPPSGSAYRRATWLLTAVALAAYATWSLRLFADGTAGWDLAIFHQAVLHYSQFHAPSIPIRGAGYVALGDHFSPVLVLAAPLYWLWADPRMLLLLQATLIASSIPIVARFARRHATDGVAFALTTAYAVGWPLQQMVSFDFHEAAFAVPLLALVLDALDRRTDRTLVLACLALLLVREDMGVVVACVGLVRAARLGASWRSRSVGLGLVATGVAAYLVVTGLVIPHFAVQGQWTYWTYDALGPDLPGSLLTIVAHPLHVAGLFVSPSVKLFTLVALFVGTLTVFRSPYLLVAAPLLASRFLSSRDALWVVFYHYSAVVWPILLLGAIDGARRLGPTAGRRALRFTAGIGLVLPAAGLFLAGPWPMFNPHPATRVVDPPPAADARALESMIPDSTCVQAGVHLAPHLVAHHRVTLPNDLSVGADFVLLDLTGRASQLGPSGPTYESMARASGYEEIGRRGRLVLLRDARYDGPSSACRP